MLGRRRGRPKEKGPGGTLKPWPEFVEGLFGGVENPGGSLKRSLGMAPPCRYAPPKCRAKPQTKKGLAMTTPQIISDRAL